MSSQQELRPWHHRTVLQPEWQRMRWELWERRTLTTYRRVIRRARYRYGWQVRRALQNVWQSEGELIASGEEDTAQKARAAADRYGVTLD